SGRAGPPPGSARHPPGDPEELRRRPEAPRPPPRRARSRSRPDETVRGRRPVARGPDGGPAALPPRRAGGRPRRQLDGALSELPRRGPPVADALPDDLEGPLRDLPDRFRRRPVEVGGGAVYGQSGDPSRASGGLLHRRAEQHAPDPGSAAGPAGPGPARGLSVADG